MDNNEPTINGLKDAMRLLGVEDAQVHIKVRCPHPLDYKHVEQKQSHSYLPAHLLHPLIGT
jgi:hypothetical protein